jgi:hypothetical protein
LQARGVEQRKSVRRSRAAWGLGMALGLALQPAWAGERTEELVERRHPSGAFSFRTPASWTVDALPVRKDVFQVSGPEGIIWFSYRRGDFGYDSLHAMCMTERLAGKEAASPALAFEYDSRESALAGRAALDSAFLVSLPTAIRDQNIWRVRAVTLVGGGESVCVVAFVPATTWKASKQVRRVVDGVVASITFRPEP